MPNGAGYTLTFDGVESTTIPGFICEKVTRRLLGKNRAVLREIAGREGAWLFGEKRGLKNIKVDGAIVAEGFPTERREALRDLANWLDKEGFKRLIISDEPDVFHRATLDNEPDLDEWRELGTFTLEFLAEPYAYANELSNRVDEIEGPSGSVSFGIPDELPAYPIIEITINGGDITGGSLTVNGLPGFHDVPMLSGTTHTINSLVFMALEGDNTDTELDGILPTSYTHISDYRGFFPIFLPGVNNVSYAMDPGSTATSVTLDITWRRRYR